MFINGKSFYGIEEAEIAHLRKNMFPVWDGDNKIHRVLNGMAKYLMGDLTGGGLFGVEGLQHDIAEDIPKFVMTKTTIEIIKKIKITGKTISMIEEYDGIKKTIADNRGQDLFAHVSFPREFYRYIIVNGNIYVVNCFLHKRPELGTDADYVGYHVWHIGIGGKPEQYENIEDHYRFFFQTLIFLKYTEPECKEVKSGQKVGTKKKGFYNLTTSDVQVVDSNWNTTVIRTEGFSVNGHLRLQPCGEGLKKRKLIWIEPFEKNGYVRQAKSTV